MDSKTIFTKTAKGLGEASGKTKALSRDLRNILKEVNGTSRFEELVDKIGSTEAKLREAFNKLMAENYIREFAQPSLGENTRALDFSTIAPTSPTARKPAEPVQRRAADFSPNAISSTAPDISPNTEIQFAEFRRLQLEEQARHESRTKANKESDEKKRREQEAKVQKELEEWALKEVGDLVPDAGEANALLEADVKHGSKDAEQAVRRAAEEDVKKQAAELARLVAEEQVKEQAQRLLVEEQARRNAEAKARLEAEAKAKAQLEAEAKARLELQEKAKRDAEEATRRAVELQAKKAVEELQIRKAAEELQARKTAEEQMRREAELKVRKEAEEKARVEAEARARKEAEEQTRRAAEEKLRREAEENAKRAAAEQARKAAEQAAAQQAAMETARRESEAKAKKEAEERARIEAEQRIRQEAEQLAKKAAEEQLKREAAETARKQAEQAASRASEAAREIEELARLEEQERARSEADARAKQAAEREEQERARKSAIDEARRLAQVARQEAKHKIKHEEQVQEKKEAEDWVRREVEERERRAAEAAPQVAEGRHEAEPELYDEPEHDEYVPEPFNDSAEESAPQVQVLSAAKAEKPYRKPVKWMRLVVVALLVAVIGGLGLVHVISFDGRIPAFEKAALDQFGQPVKIKALHVSLFPQPHWKLDGVTIGSEGQIVASRIKAVAGLGSLFGGGMAFSSIELESPVLSETGLDWLLFGKFKGTGLQFDRLAMSKARVDSASLPIGLIDATATMGPDGVWKKIVIEAPETKLHIQMQPKGELLQIELAATAFTVPFGAELALEHISADGTVSRNEVHLTQFRASFPNASGTLIGSARFKHDDAWKLSGQMSATYPDASQLVPGSLQSGKLTGDASFMADNKDLSKLLAGLRMDGNFLMRDGVLLGIDLAGLLKNSNIGGKTSFSELNGGFLYENGKLQLRSVSLGAGLLAARGNITVEQDKNLSGRFQVEIKSTSVQSRANLNVAGTLKEPRYSP
jgi:hypothetical protein